MRKINWKGSDEYASARVGSINLYCYLQHPTSNSNYRWFAIVSTSEHKGYYAAEVRKGPIRYSLSKAKEDAIRLTCELLIDYQVALDAEKKNFDL
jgi:hypothetical protein